MLVPESSHRHPRARWPRDTKRGAEGGLTLRVERIWRWWSQACGERLGGGGEEEVLRDSNEPFGLRDLGDSGGEMPAQRRILSAPSPSNSGNREQFISRLKAAGFAQSSSGTRHTHSGDEEPASFTGRHLTSYVSTRKSLWVFLKGGSAHLRKRA